MARPGIPRTASRDGNPAETYKRQSYLQEVDRKFQPGRLALKSPLLVILTETTNHKHIVVNAFRGILDRTIASTAIYLGPKRE